MKGYKGYSVIISERKRAGAGAPHLNATHVPLAPETRRGRRLLLCLHCDAGDTPAAGRPPPPLKTEQGMKIGDVRLNGKDFPPKPITGVRRGVTTTIKAVKEGETFGFFRTSQSAVSL